ncbi:MAG TPA: mechanosensitive ion channel domain-containing protein [Steroidobacteraceae bacterium]|jgi:small-conductance mechanosensitive channel|nr:mechanosensitive ion channel domain-containing protein [Steroidobacteraceae bacterium]
MNGFYGALTALLHGWLVGLFGSGVDRRVLGPITWADLAPSVAVLALVAIVNGVSAIIVRHKMQPDAALAQPKNLRHHMFGALRAPLYLLIWICGIYFAAAPLLPQLRPTGRPDVLDRVLDTLFNLGMFAVVFWFLFRFTHVLEARMAVWASRTRSRLDDLFVPLLGRGLRVVLPVIAVIFALPILGLPAAYAGMVAKGTSVLLIVAVGIVLFQAVQIGESALLLRFDISAADNLQARKIYTQVHVIGRVIYVVIGLFTLACILMLFQEVRHVGTSLLASAGIVGIIAGVAGQKSLANLFAGFQIALAQPIRQDDVVIVEGAWGRIEEITLSYVVVHVWDDTRLVLPLTYFIEKPFQNWTRTSAQLLGSVFVWVDYSFPVDEGRKALQQIIEASALWDRRFWNLQVSDATEKTMQLRVLATAADSSKSWDLRCEIREKFIAFIQRSHPQSLPLVRAQMAGTVAPVPGGAAP